MRRAFSGSAAWAKDEKDKRDRRDRRETRRIMGRVCLRRSEAGILEKKKADR
jgi:hypothetical protein